ncbi:MAG: cytochrome P450, partial [Saccharothrix sp.]|nr:cytochrome P450 [Saccharothrix sp.]
MAVTFPDFVDKPGGRGDLDPYGNFAWLRRTAPISAVPGPPGSARAWLVTSYDLAKECLADPRLSVDPKWSPTPPARPDDRGDPLASDPPLHTRLRRLITPVFSPGNSAKWRDRIERTCHELVDGFADKGYAELVSEYCLPIPVAVVHDFIGVPEEERMAAQECAALFLRAGVVEQSKGGPAKDALIDYVRRVVAARKGVRGDDVITVLLDGLDRGELHSEAEVEGMLYVLLGAGQISTGPMIASALYRLLASGWDGPPDRLDRRAVVTEALRLDSPVQSSVNRYAVEDLDLGGERVRQGDIVVVSLAAANRDPARFAEPDEFRPARTRSNLAFG